MQAQKIEWVDGATIELESSTPTGTGLRLVFKDGRVFEMDLVEPIVTHERWKTFKLVCVCKAVRTKAGELVPCPTSSWGKRIEKLWKPKVQKGEERDITELALIGFAGFELNENGGLDHHSIEYFALFESAKDRQLIVGIKALRESHLQQNELPNLIFETLKEQGEKIDRTLKLQRESKEQFEPLKGHLHAVFALFRKQVRKQAASKGGAAHGVKKKIGILANELARVGPPELMQNKRQKLRSIPDPVFFKYLLGRVHGEDWADEFFAGEIKSGAVSGETLRRWSRTLECHPLVAQFISKLQAVLAKSPKEYEDSIDNEDLNEGFRTTSNP